MHVADLKLIHNAARLSGQTTRVCLVLVLTGLLVAGCNRPAPEQIIGPAAKVLAPQPDRCNLDGLNPLIGKDFIALADQPLNGTLRVIWPGQEISAEVMATRLNAQVNDQGLIERLFCG